MWIVVSIRPDGSHGHVWSRHRREKRADLRVRSGSRSASVVYVPDPAPKTVRRSTRKADDVTA